MSIHKNKIVAVFSGLVLALYLRYGLEPTGWLFYEMSFFLGVEWLYWGYTVFRGAGYAFSLWAFQTWACVIAGSTLTFWLLRRVSKREQKKAAT